MTKKVKSLEDCSKNQNEAILKIVILFGGTLS